MHDIVDLEGRGIPGAFVATTAFVDGVQQQARGLGFDPVAVYVAHPIQDRTDAEVVALADAAIEEIVAGVATRA